MVVDIIIGSVLLISAIIAFLRGFIREVLTILGVVGGLAASYAAGPYVVSLFQGWLGVEEEDPEKFFDLVPYTLIADVLAYGSIFIIVVIILSFISHMLAEAARNVGLGAVDRTLGVIFGIVRGLVFLALLYLPIYYIVDEGARKKAVEDSKTYIYVEKLALYFAEFLPERPIEDTKEAIEDEKDSDVRDKLEEMDILRDGIERLNGEGEDADAPGYDEEFRQKMDELFQEQSGDRNEQLENDSSGSR